VRQTDPVNLIIVDERSEQAQFWMESLGPLGASIVTVESGADVLSLPNLADVDVVVAPWPASAGDDYAAADLTWLQAIRADGRIRSLPILFLAKFLPSEATLDQLYALGAVEVLAEPLSSALLRGKVASLAELVRCRREVARTEQQSLWRMTLTSIGDGVIATDVEGLVTFLNPVAERLTGWTTPAARGRPLTEVFHIVNETTRQPVENPALRSLDTGTIVGLANHTVLIARDGTERPIDDSASPIRGEDGAIGGAILVFRDISDRKQAEAARARVAAIVESSDDVIISKTLDGIIQSWNSSAERVFGYTAAEVIGKSITLIIPPERIDEERVILERLRRGERIDHFETVRVSKDGHRVDIAITVSPIRDGEGRVIGVSKVARDITAAKESRRMLALAQLRSETALQAGEVGTYYWDIVHDYVSGDRNFVALFGVLPDDKSRAPVADFLQVIHAEDQQRVGDEIRRTLESDQPFRSEYRIHSPQGQRWLLARGIVERDSQGQPTGWAGVVVDITERKEAEDALRASNERFRIVAKATNDAVWDWDMRTDAVWWNEGVTALFGHAPDQVGHDAKWWYDQIHPEDRDRVVESIHAVIDHGRANWSDEYRFRKGSGEYATVLDRGYAIFAEGKTIRLVGAMQDVTEQRRANERLRESEAQFRSLFESMDEGYCVVEPILDHAGRPVDYRYLLVNPALVAHTGLKDIVGKTARQVMPSHETHWIEAYGRVAATGETLRRTDYVADLERWFEVSAFPIGRGHVGVLFSDVSARHRAEEALRESEQQLADVFRHAPSFMAVLRGPDHVFERANDHYLELVGGREVVGKTVREALPEVVDQGFVRLLDDVYQTGNPWVGTGTKVSLARHGDSRPDDRYLDFVYQPLRSSDGSVTGILVQGIDQTERLRTQRLLREKEERLELLVDRARDYAVVITDPAGTIVEWTGGAEGITGFPATEAVGNSADFFFTPEDRAAGVPAKELALAAREGRAEDKRWHRKQDGTEFFADGVMVPLRGDDGALHGFGKLFRDVTARKRAEESIQFLADASVSLAELVDYQSTLHRIASLAVGDFADTCLVDLINEGGERQRQVAMHARQHRTGSEIAEQAEIAPKELLAHIVSPVLQTGEPAVVTDLADMAITDADKPGEWIAALQQLGVHSYLSAPLLSRGRVIGCLTFLGTSSRRRFGPDELRVVQDLAERVTVALENAQLYQALQEQDRRKDEFLATLAHELRNPLAPVRNGVQILSLGLATDEEEAQVLSMMDRQLGHMTHLVNDLLDVARVSSGKVVLRKERASLGTLVDAAVETSRQSFDTAGHELLVQLPPQAIQLDVDRTRLVQVLANLLNNAAKYTPPGGRTILSAALDTEGVTIRVTDTGVGIPTDMLTKVFDMFTQVGTSLERSQGGLGIGLTLVKRLVELHGGTVKAESPGPGQGSTFSLWLPLPAEPVRSKATSAPDRGGKSSRPLEVLVVDDNRDSAESLALLLRYRGHVVRTAHDGPEALRLLESLRPQLIVLDLGLPGMSGFDVARKIRESADLKHVKLAALTGWGQEEDRRRTKEAGFDHHLVKPAELEQIERILNSIQASS
jgi:PAS domain S-box-containing protein